MINIKTHTSKTIAIMRIRPQDIISLRAAIYDVAPDVSAIRLVGSRLHRSHAQRGNASGDAPALRNKMLDHLGENNRPSDTGRWSVQGCIPIHALGYAERENDKLSIMNNKIKTAYKTGIIGVCPLLYCYPIILKIDLIFVDH